MARTYGHRRGEQVDLEQIVKPDEMLHSGLNRRNYWNGSNSREFQGIQTRDDASSGSVLRDSDCEDGMWTHLVKALGKHESCER